MIARVLEHWLDGSIEKNEKNPFLSLFDSPLVDPSRKAVHPFSTRIPCLTVASRLRPGTPAAPKRDYLPLLPSGSGGVRRLLPRRTQSSTSLNSDRTKSSEPQRGVRSRYSGLRVQGTASSPPSTTNRMLVQYFVKVKWRRGWDSNPRSIAAYAISNRADSATLAPLRTTGDIIPQDVISNKPVY